jgi:hypothetical protein
VKLPIELINTYNLLKSNVLSNDVCIEHVNSILKQINLNSQSKSFLLKSLGLRKYSTSSKKMNIQNNNVDNNSGTNSENNMGLSFFKVVLPDIIHNDK